MERKQFIQCVRLMLLSSLSWIYCALEPKGKSLYNGAHYLLQSLFLLLCDMTTDQEIFVPIDIPHAIAVALEDKDCEELLEAISIIATILTKLKSSGITSRDAQDLVSILRGALKYVDLAITEEYKGGPFALVGYYNTEEAELFGITSYTQKRRDFK